MDIQTGFAARLYDTTRKLGAAQGAPGTDPAVAGTTFADTLARAAQEITGTIRRGEAAAMQGASGSGDVQSVVEALTATEFALQTAVSVRDRVVEAYQEVLRMPV